MCVCVCELHSVLLNQHLSKIVIIAKKKNATNSTWHGAYNEGVNIYIFTPDLPKPDFFCLLLSSPNAAYSTNTEYPHLMTVLYMFYRQTQRNEALGEAYLILEK